METIIHIILGIVQGVTEFLPVSSSGHSALLPWIFGFEDPGLSFSVALHLGTLFAVLIMFWRPWVQIFRAAFSRKKVGEFEPTMLWKIALATLPAAFLGVLIEDAARSVLRSPLIIASTLAIVGVLLFVADRFVKQGKYSALGWGKVFVIGLAQATALVPGVSRAGATMIAGLALGLSREASAQFSFLLAVPIVLGAGIFALRDITITDINIGFVLGVITSAIVGAWAIRFLLRYLKRNTFAPFATYRVALAGAIVIMYLTRL